MRIAIYLTGEGTSFCLENYGSYADLFVDLLAEPGAEFDVFDNQAGAFPEDVTQYDAVVLTGSAADAHGDDPWIEKLNQSIRDAHAAKRKIVGVCFGHQAVANALGGRSYRNPSGWELGVHQLSATDAFQAEPYTEGVDLDSLNILQIHQDHVETLPPDGRLLAHTPATPVQVFAVGDHVLCMQGHPEFNEAILRDLVERRMESGKISKDAGQAALDSLSLNPSRKAFETLLRRFLYSGS